MKRYWEKARAAVDKMSLRERAMAFVAIALVGIALLDMVLLNPLLAKQKALSAQAQQQQEKMKELQAQIENLVQVRLNSERSPLHDRLVQLKQQLQEQDSFLQSRRDRLVEPNKMADLLRQVLNKNGKLQLVELKTLPVSLLVEKSTDGAAQPPAANSPDGKPQPDTQQQIFKHGVQITVRGGYLDLMHYIAALENMPAKVFWGGASLSVEKYPNAVFTLNVYTLSLNKTWLTI